MGLALGFTVEHNTLKDEEGDPLVGTAVDLIHTQVPVQGEDGTVQIEHRFLAAVLWEQIRTPAPSFHGPDELSWMDIPSADEAEEDDATATS